MSFAVLVVAPEDKDSRSYHAAALASFALTSWSCPPPRERGGGGGAPDDDRPHDFSQPTALARHFPELAESGDVVTIDLPGFGASTLPSGRLELSSSTAELLMMGTGASGVLPTVREIGRIDGKDTRAPRSATSRSWPGP